MRQDLSQLIYKELINGNLITKTHRQSEQLVPNPLFDELANAHNIEQYKTLYASIGYELKQLKDCFFLNELGKNEVLSEVAMKIQALLVVLCRGVTQIPLLISVLTDFNAGISKTHLETMDQHNEFQQILRAVGIKNPLSREVENTLITRHIAYWNHFDRLVLSDGGITLLEHLSLDVLSTES